MKNIMKHFKIVIASLAVFMGLSGALLPSVALAATPKSTVCETLGSDASCTQSTGNGVNLNRVIRGVINILSIVIGVAAVIMIMVGGFRYITAGGDANNVSSAKNTIIYAIVGLVVVAMAQFIVQFVLGKVK